MISYYRVVVEHQREIMRALLAGQRIEVVAWNYGMSRASLHRHLTRLGYTVPDGRSYMRRRRKIQLQERIDRRLMAEAELRSTRRGFLCSGCGFEGDREGRCPKCVTGRLAAVEIGVL